MFREETCKFDCSHLLDEIEMTYQDLCDVLGIPLGNTPHRLMRQLLAYVLEDVVNKTTEARFRDNVTLTKNLLINYLENEVKLDSYDHEDIDKIFIEPLFNEAAVLLGKLSNKFSRYYSIWEVSEGEVFPTMVLTYKGDYRIEDWHKIQDVPSRAVVAVKRHRINYLEVADAIRDALRYLDDLAATDIPTLVDDIIGYYTGGQLEELYVAIIQRVKMIAGDQGTYENSKAVRQVKSLIKNLENITSFKRFVSDLDISEQIYTNITNRSIIFDVVTKSKTADNKAFREEVLEEIDKLGFVKGDIAGKVEIIYG